MDEDFFRQLSRDVGETKANTENLIQRFNENIIPVLNEHSAYISRAKVRWAWLSGFTALLSLSSSFVYEGLTDWIKRHVG